MVQMEIQFCLSYLWWSTLDLNIGLAVHCYKLYLKVVREKEYWLSAILIFVWLHNFPSDFCWRNGNEAQTKKNPKA